MTKALTRKERSITTARALDPKDRTETQDDLLFFEERDAIKGGMTNAQWKKRFPKSNYGWAHLVCEATGEGESSQRYDQWNKAHGNLPLKTLIAAAAAVIKEMRKDVAGMDRKELLAFLSDKRWEKPGFRYEE